MIIDAIGGRPPDEETSLAALLADKGLPIEARHALQAMAGNPGRPKRASRKAWQEWINAQLNAPAGGK